MRQIEYGKIFVFVQTKIRLLGSVGEKQRLQESFGYNMIVNHTPWDLMAWKLRIKLWS